MCHVLVIEDEWLIAEYVTMLVEDAGATSVEVALTQGEAVAMADRRPPEVIVSDVLLLEGTGPSAVQAIIERHGPVPVIFVTATPADCRPCASPAVVLRKPVDARELTRRFLELAPV